MPTQDDGAPSPPDPFSPPVPSPTAAQPASEDHPEQLSQQLQPASMASADGSLPGLPSDPGGDAAMSHPLPSPARRGPMQRLMTDDLSSGPAAIQLHPAVGTPPDAVDQDAGSQFHPDANLAPTQPASQLDGSLQPTDQDDPHRGLGRASQLDPSLPPTQAADVPADAATEGRATHAATAGLETTQPAEVAPGRLPNINPDMNPPGAAGDAPAASSPDEVTTAAAGAGVRPSAAQELPGADVALARRPCDTASNEPAGAGGQSTAAKSSAAAVGPAAPAKPRSAAKKVPALPLLVSRVSVQALPGCEGGPPNASTICLILLNSASCMITADICNGPCVSGLLALVASVVSMRCLHRASASNLYA